MRRKPISLSFRNAIRAVKDSDELVVHIGNIAERYRREHALDEQGRAQPVRSALRALQKQAEGLSVWLQAAQKDNAGVPEHEALAKVSMSLHGIPGRALADSAAIRSWLTQVGNAAGQCLLAADSKPRKATPAAPGIAVEALRATFEHHKLKWSAAVSKNRQADAVRLLCAIAKHAGDDQMTPLLARQWLLAKR